MSRPPKPPPPRPPRPPPPPPRALSARCGVRKRRIGGANSDPDLSHLRWCRGRARHAPRRMYQMPPQGPLQRPQTHREIRTQGKHDEMEGTAKRPCPKRNAHSMHERCDLVCPDLPKIL